MSRRKLRLSLRGPTDLVVELDPADPAQAGPAPWALVLPLPPTNLDDAIDRLEVVLEGWRFEVTVEPAARAALREKAARVAGELERAATSVLRAQIPGRVTRVWVGPGDEVEQGQRLLSIEAMKMENELRAPHAGRVERVTVVAGALVERDAELVTLA